MTSLSYVNFEIPTSGYPVNYGKFSSILKSTVMSVEVSEIDFLEKMRRLRHSYEEHSMMECRFLAGYDSLHFLMSFADCTGQFLHGSREDGRTGTVDDIPVFQVGARRCDLLAILPKEVSDDQFLSMIEKRGWGGV